MAVLAVASYRALLQLVDGGSKKNGPLQQGYGQQGRKIHEDLNRGRAPEFLPVFIHGEMKFGSEFMTGTRG